VRLAAVTLLAILAGVAAVAPAAQHLQPVVPKPNIVFVLTDDLSWDLVQYMPNVRRMERDGTTFTNYFVTDSLCCPSRASIFTGRYPHNTGVLTNTPPSGGFLAFRRGAETNTFATSLQAGGYRTAMMGKYLNGYQTRYRKPPGWSNWQVSSGGYKGFNYDLRANGRIAHFGRAPRVYMTDLLRRRGKDFISQEARRGLPLMVEIATLAPHRPSVPAPRDRHDFPGLEAPRDAAFDAAPRNATSWLRDRPPLTPEEIAALNSEYRRRAQSVQAVDELVGQVRRLLRERGLDRNTYVVFSSDNGYHMGQRRLLSGKMTPYDSDVRVPLIVVGPGIKRGSVTRRLAENIDLAPTFMRLAGRVPPSSVDGESLVPLLHGRAPAGWRDAVLIEHHHPPTPNGDPDHQDARSGNPPSYEALRTRDLLYVEYVTGEREFYDLRGDPAEMDNTYDELDGATRALLHRRLVALENCSGNGCRRSAAVGLDHG
jgi:N-acetylglucosamine-6-sulfatase